MTRALARTTAWLALCAAALAVLVPLLTLPRYDAHSRVWLIDASGSAMATDDGYAFVAATLQRRELEPRLRDAGLPVSMEEVLSGMAWSVTSDGLAAIHFTDPDPAVALDVANLLGSTISVLHPSCEYLPGARPESALLPNAPPGAGWRLLGASALLPAATLALAGLGLRQARNAYQPELALGLGAVGLLLSMAAPQAAPGAAVGVAICAIVALGWRGALLISVVASALRGGAFDPLLPGWAWVAAQLGALALAAGWLWRWRPPRPPRDGPLLAMVGALAALVGLAAATAPWSLVPLRSFGQAMVLAVIGFFCLALSITRWRRAHVVVGDLAVLVGACATLSAVGLLAWALGGQRWPWNPISDRFQSLWFNPNALGLLAATLSVASLALGWHRRQGGRPGAAAWWTAAAAILAVTLVLTGSRGALGGFVVGIVVLALVAGGARAAILTAVGALGVGALSALATRDLELFRRAGELMVDSGRGVLWREALSRFVTSPIIGVGYRTGNSDGVTYTYHNVYLSWLVELGALGLAAFIVLVGAAVWRGRGGRPILAGALACVGFAELYDSSAIGFLGPTALTVWLILMAHASLAPTSGRRPGLSDAGGTPEATRRRRRRRWWDR